MGLVSIPSTGRSGCRGARAEGTCPDGLCAPRPELGAKRISRDQRTRHGRRQTARSTGGRGARAHQAGGGTGAPPAETPPETEQDQGSRAREVAGLQSAPGHPVWHRDAPEGDVSLSLQRMFTSRPGRAWSCFLIA